MHGGNLAIYGGDEENNFKKPSLLGCLVARVKGGY